jgi:hypothetical protein
MPASFFPSFPSFPSFSYVWINSYTQEIPTRFKKEIVQAAAGGNDQGIGLAGVERLLANITTGGNTAATVTVSKQDLQLIFTEVGTGGQIPTQRFFQMI